MKRDRIYSKPQEVVKDFVFDEDVAEVFDDMISRSVPFYSEAQRSTALLARRFAKSNSSVYDLGCSTGTTLIELCRYLSDTSIRLVGVDSSSAMLDQCKGKLNKTSFEPRIRLENCSLEDIKISSASVVILNYTLQFIASNLRLDLLKRIYCGLLPGGVVLLAEKVKHDDPYFESLFTDVYLDFKRDNGYSDLEISQKRDALEQVLIPFTPSQNVKLLKDAGFSAVEVYLKFYNFAGLIGVK